jgi:CubicO group peptidase (beta-lactamase class C family)
MKQVPGMRVTKLGALLLAATALPGLASPSAAAPAARRAPAHAVAPRGTIDPARLRGLADFVDGVVAAQIASREVAGAVISVVYDGRILFTRGYGYANVAERRPVDPLRTLFRPGSVSKLFTYTALMQQVELGRIDLDADVNNYLDFRIPPFHGHPIRVRDLMQHSEGMSDVGGIITRDPNNLPNYGDWIKKHIPERVWESGTEIAYSNYGVAVAGYIVERVSGERFADYVERHIFRPLGMNSTTFREPLPSVMQANMALGYRLVDGRFVAQPYEFVRAITPAGASSATGPDMARFMLALLGGGQLGTARILKPSSVRFLFTDSIANTPGLPGMAHGFYVIHEANPRLVGHAGNTGDFHSDLILAPEHGFGFFISETGGRGSGAARTELAEAIIGKVFPQQPALRWTGTDNPAPPAGSYRGNRRDYGKAADPKFDFKVSMPEPHLVVIDGPEGKTAWEQIGPRTYQQITAARAGGPYDRLQFYGLPDDPRFSFSFEPYDTYRFVKP